MLKKNSSRRFSWQEYRKDCVHLATFVFFHLLIAGVCQYLCLRALQMDSSFKEALFSLMLYLAHYGSLFAGFAAILMLFRFFGKRFSVVFSLISSWLIFLALIFDTGVFLQWKFHVNMPMVALFLSPAGAELVTFPVFMYVVGVLGILAVTGIEIFFWWASRKLYFPKTLLAIFFVAFINFVAFQAWNVFVFYHNRNSYMIRTEAVPFFFGLTANDLLRAHGVVRENQSIELKTKSGALRYPLSPLRFGKQKRPNVLMIVVDSLRADCFNAEVMPKMFHRAEVDGARFLHHYSGGNCTRTGMFTLFYGIPGTYWNAALKSNTPSAVMLAAKTAGYEIGIYSSTLLTNPELHQTVFCNVPGLRLSPRGGGSVSRDQGTIQDMLSFLSLHQKNSESPYFAVLFLDAIHANFKPKNYPNRFPTDLDTMNYMILNNSDPTLHDRVLNLYRNCSNWMDFILDDCLQKLSETDALQNTIVILTGDHGQEANETRTNSWAHNSNYTRYQIQTPMVIWGISGKKGVYSHVTTHMDVPVTLLRAMGCENPPSDFSTGKDLFDSSNRGTVVLSSYLNRGIFVDGKILDITRSGASRSYDMDGKSVPSNCTRENLQDALEQMKRYAR
ncbi:MAG: sulfatase-like hydrolase/transferase [Victivallaceae bacterium]|nr:sulfatase-like hydrolase/transferase [Victivallaceae bacterium]